MIDKRRWKSPATAGVLAALVALAATLPLAAQSFQRRTYQCPPCLGVANTFIRADVGPNGGWVVGTTGGDPDSAADDDKNLLYGFTAGGGSWVGTGYATVRIAGPKGTVDEVVTDPAPQSSAPGRVDTVWDFITSTYRVQVTQTLQIQQNPFSGRPDVIGARYTATNLDQMTLSVGIRALLDVKLGNNDGSPYFIPGIGTWTSERSFAGAEVPDYWLAFESKVYDPIELRSVGILRGRDVTPPDRFVLAWWKYVQKEKWDFEVDPTRPITDDSAVALYWDPVPLAPGASRTVATQYGLTTNRGGRAFLSAPVEARCGDTVSIAIFVNNFDTFALTGGVATLRLPPGLALAPGETLAKPMADIAPGGTGSVVWAVAVGAGTTGLMQVDATASFDGGRQFAADTRITVSCPVPPPTPTATASPTPVTPSPTPTAPPPTATPDRPPANACAYILRRVPPAAISAALANPEHVYGWMEPANPALPPGPNNPPKTRLSIRNLGVPYHPLSNPLVFKVGCP